MQYCRVSISFQNLCTSFEGSELCLLKKKNYYVSCVQSWAHIFTVCIAIWIFYIVFYYARLGMNYSLLWEVAGHFDWLNCYKMLAISSFALLVTVVIIFSKVMHSHDMPCYLPSSSIPTKYISLKIYIFHGICQ